MNDDTVTVEVTIDVPIERAFEVFTKGFDIWWPHAFHLGEGDQLDTVVVEPRAGGRFYETSAGGKECDWGQVLVWDPPNAVALSWQIQPDFTPEPDPRRASRVNVSFTADGASRTQVKLVHSDFERHGENWEQMRDGVSGDSGWPGILQVYAHTAAA
jgi:uncharacterized protein YndB with AHSA1/START domain